MTVSGFPLWVVLWVMVEGSGYKPFTFTQVNNSQELRQAKTKCDNEVSNLRGVRLSAACDIRSKQP